MQNKYNGKVHYRSSPYSDDTVKNQWSTTLLYNNNAASLHCLRFNGIINYKCSLFIIKNVVLLFNSK